MNQRDGNRRDGSAGGRLHEYWSAAREIIDEYGNDKVPKLAAALSYYTVFSLAPMLVICIALAGFIFGQDAAQGRIATELSDLFGREAATMIQAAIQKTAQTQGGMLATILSIVVLAISAVAAFIELQDSLDIIWKVRAKPGQALWGFVRNRLISFALIVALGFLLLVSLVVSAALNALQDYLSARLPIAPMLLDLLNNVITLGVIFVLFSMIYKILPDVQLSWKDVRMGSLVTTVLFIAGKYLIGLYLGRGSVGSTYGAAGSLAIIFVWVYYSAQILFLGAEFTYVYACRYGSGIKPSPHAVKAIVKVEEQKA